VTEEAEISACKGYFPPLSDGGRLRRGGPIPHRGRQFTGNGDFLEKEWSGAVFADVAQSCFRVGKNLQKFLNIFFRACLGLFRGRDGLLQPFPATLRYHKRFSFASLFPCKK